MSDTSTPPTAKGWTDLTLPSQGIYYRDANGQPTVPGGKVQIRRLTVGEQAQLQSPGMDVIQRIAAIIRAACRLPNGTSPDSLLLTDRQAVLLYQRVITLGPKYGFTFRCPGCRKTSKHEVNILQDLSEVTPDELRPELDKRGLSLDEPFPVELPDEGVQVSCRMLRGEDEAEIAKRSKQNRNMRSLPDDPGDPSVVISLALIIVAVNGERWDTRRKEQMVRGMTMRDSNIIQRAVEARETGVDTTVFPTCNQCGYEFSEGVSLPFGGEFFRPSADSLGDVAGTSVLPSIPRRGVH